MKEKGTVKIRAHHFGKVSILQETAREGKGRATGMGQESQEREVSCVSKDIASGSSAMIGCVPGIPVLEN